MTVEQLIKSLNNCNFQSTVDIARDIDAIKTYSLDEIESVIVERYFDEDGDGSERVYLLIKQT